MKGKRARLEALEEKRRAFEASHVRRSDVSGFLFAVLEVVEDVAGADVGARVAGRVVEYQAGRVLSALAGKTAAELEDLARRVGVPVPDLTGLSAAELVRLYFDPATWGQA